MSTREPSINMTLEEYDLLLQEMENIKQERDELKQSLEQTVNEKSHLSSEIEANQAIITQLRWRIADLSRRLWGKSSEKRSLPENPVHLNVCFDSPSDVEDPVVEEKKAVAKATKTENVYNRFRKNFTKKSPLMHANLLTRLCLGKKSLFPCRKEYPWMVRSNWVKR